MFEQKSLKPIYMYIHIYIILYAILYPNELADFFAVS